MVPPRRISRGPATVRGVPFDRSAFDEDTGFERLVMAQLGQHRLEIPEPTMVYHAEANPEGRGGMVVRIGPAEEGTQLRDDLRASLRPLSFGAAYKTLDMLIEYLQRAAHGAPDQAYSEKVKWARRAQPPLPTPLAQDPGIWERLALLYGDLKGARDAVVHRRAKPLKGEFVIYDGQRQEVDRISDEEISAFTGAVHGIAETVVGTDSDRRRVGMVAWYLNALRRRHGLSDLSGAVDPQAGVGRLVMDALPTRAGRLTVDVARAQGITTAQPYSLWEIELHAGVRRFFGRWEDFPTGTGPTFDFDPDAPPDFLVERVV